MRSILTLVAVLCLLSLPAVAHPACAPAVTPPVAAAVGGGSAASPVLFLGAVGAAAGAVYLIGTNQDPVWHPLACWLFGDEGRVGKEKQSACAYKNP